MLDYCLLKSVWNVLCIVPIADTTKGKKRKIVYVMSYVTSIHIYKNKAGRF